MPLRKLDWRGSLAAKLLLCHAIAMVCALLIGVSAWYGLPGHQAPTITAHIAQSLAETLSASLRFDARGQPLPLTLPDDVRWVANQWPDDFSVRLVATPPTAEATRKAGAERPSAPNAPPIERPAQTPNSARVGVNALIIHTYPINRGDQHWRLQVTVSERLGKLLLITTAHRMPEVVLGIAALSILVLGAALAFIAQRALRPLARASLEASHIDPSNPEMRMNEAGLPSEILPLVRAFNAALSRLQLGFQTQRRFLADAAHELKTPLALIRAQLELNGVESKDELIHDVDRMSRQIQQLLTLAEITEVEKFQMRSHDLAHIAREVMDSLEPLAARKDIQLNLFAPDIQSHTECDEGAVFALLRNLIENAISVSPVAGEVAVHISRSDITVRDWGTGIQQEHLAHLFDRFWRAPGRTEGGAGLGLSICKEITAAHGWTLEAHRLPRGAQFVVRHID